MRELTAVTRALDDEGRVRILAALRGGELCVCQVVELLELAPSTVSRHLALLRQAGLVEKRKAGRWIHYRLAGEDGPAVARGALSWVLSACADERRIAEDAARLERILELDPEVLCERQRAGCASPRERSARTLPARGEARP